MIEILVFMIPVAWVAFVWITIIAVIKGIRAGLRRIRA